MQIFKFLKSMFFLHRDSFFWIKNIIKHIFLAYFARVKGWKIYQNHGLTFQENAIFRLFESTFLLSRNPFFLSLNTFFFPNLPRIKKWEIYNFFLPRPWTNPFARPQRRQCMTKTSNFQVTHYFYGWFFVGAYQIFCFLCSWTLLFLPPLIYTCLICSLGPVYMELRDPS